MKIPKSFDELILILKVRGHLDDVIQPLLIKAIKDAYEQGSYDTANTVPPFINKIITDMQLCSSCAARLTEKFSNARIHDKGNASSIHDL